MPISQSGSPSGKIDWSITACWAFVFVFVVSFWAVIIWSVKALLKLL